MKNVIWIIVAAVVALGAYLVFTTKSVEEAAEDISGASVEAPEALESAADAAGEATSEAVEEAVEATTDAADEAADTATEAAEEVVDEATTATDEAVDTTTEATEAATGTATDALSVDGFSMDKVNGMIDGSELDDLKKAMLKGALEKAQDNPEMLTTVLGQVKAALGM